MKGLTAGLFTSVIIATGLVAGTAQAESLSQDCVRWNKLLYKALKIMKKPGEYTPETLPDIIRGVQATCNWDMSETLKVARGISGSTEGNSEPTRSPYCFFLSKVPDARRKVAKLMEAAQSENAQANAAVAILDRGCGKPTQPTEGRLDVTYHVRDEPMPMDEWRKRFVE
jgi:hypothetical protein